MDINECLVNNGGCDPRTRCYNTPGAAKLRPSLVTGTFSPVIAQGAENAESVLPATTSVRLQPDLAPAPRRRVHVTLARTGDGYKGCVDVDECAPGNSKCDARTDCSNFDGGYSCTKCPEGFQGSGKQGCKSVVPRHCPLLSRSLPVFCNWPGLHVHFWLNPAG
jgi:hypothetical protein